MYAVSSPVVALSRGYPTWSSFKSSTGHRIRERPGWNFSELKASVACHASVSARGPPRAALPSPDGSRAQMELGSQFQVEPKHSLTGESSWTRRIADTKFGKILAPIVASAGFYLQVSGSTLAEVAEVDSSAMSDEEFVTLLLTSGFFVVLYLFVIPAITYNYLRLRWYKRNAAETFFQFMLVFIFFPGMLLLAPFINFRRLPKEGTEPP